MLSPHRGGTFSRNAAPREETRFNDAEDKHQGGKATLSFCCLLLIEQLLVLFLILKEHGVHFLNQKKKIAT